MDNSLEISSNKKYLPTKIRLYLTSYWWPWTILILLLTIGACVEFTSATHWDNDEGSGADAPAVFFVIGMMIQVIFVVVSLSTMNLDTRKYNSKLKESKYGTPVKLISAEVLSGGKVGVYENTSSIMGQERKLIHKFDPELVDEKEIYNYVSEKRDELNPDYSNAEAIVKAINNG